MFSPEMQSIVNKNIDMLLESVFTESINDKYLFKALFMAGGSGSGKSFVSEKMFSGKMIKIVNSDTLFEVLLHKQKLPLKIDDKFKDVYEKQMDVRKTAKGLTGKKLSHIINGMIPLVVDGTGKDYEKIEKQSKALEAIGYDTGMVFVNVSLNVAMKRNEMRDRSVPEAVVKKSYRQVQNNIGKFQELFDPHFWVIDNNTVLKGSDLQAFQNRMAKIAMKYFEKPLSNFTGKQIIEKLESSGGSTLNDLDFDWREKLPKI